MTARHIPDLDGKLYAARKRLDAFNRIVTFCAVFALIALVYICF